MKTKWCGRLARETVQKVKNCGELVGAQASLPAMNSSSYHVFADWKSALQLTFWTVSRFVLLFTLPVPLFAAKSNVLLISIDTLRADHLGCYGYRTKTPAIDTLASESMLFENTISQVPLTLPSHSTIFTGLYPDQHGVRNNENFVLAGSFKTLAEIFQQNGFNTGGVIGSFSLDSGFGIYQGFQYYEDQIGQGHDPEINRHVERRAETVWKLGRKWIESQKGPWFTFLHFFDPHFGFNPPSGYPQTYDGEIAYTDKVVGEILQFLKDKKLMDSTIIVLLSDHGESLGEHGEDNHGVFLYDATLKVPFLIHAPGLTAQRIANQVRLVDVAPTLVELAGLPKQTGFAGESLLPLTKGVKKNLPAYSESYYTNLLMGWAPLHSMRWSQKKWIDAPKPELYDLERDPRELKNIYSSSAISSGLRSELQKHLKRNPSQTQQQPDPETQEKLASLGYVTGGSPHSGVSRFDPKDGIALWIEIESAVRSAQLSQWAEAEKSFRNVLTKQPDNVIATKFLANVLRKQGKNDEAITLMQSALKSNFHQTETRFHLAETYLDTKQYSEALSQASAILKEEPENMRALAMAAWLQSQLQKDQEALQTYKKLASLRKLNEKEALDAAAIQLTSRNNQEAEKYFRMALQANPKSTAAWKGLALILASKQQWEESLEAFLKAGDCESIKKFLQRVEIASPRIEAVRAKCP
ncbi:sulfatase-like hydrolase/transferase [bacterium]|nr:sulfatase-like hydrolase/transferase [bacterium]MCI0602031.1 sulfatase-like hydrolase/transferase [bacterium]